jgi:hypothetical protein
VREKLIAGLLTMLGSMTGAMAAGTNALPVPMPPPTTYSAPSPAPMAPPINPGPATVPPAGLSPLLTEPGPVYPITPQAMPAYPPADLPGPVGQQNMQSYRNGLLGQQRRLERKGVSPGSERSREIQQQLNQPSWR